MANKSRSVYRGWAQGKQMQTLLREIAKKIKNMLLYEANKEEYHCVTNLGEHFIILRNDKGTYLCPVCGSAEFDEPPYNKDGTASFQICSCGFEFGYDDSHLASKDATESVISSWNRWRLKVIDNNKRNKQSLEKLEHNLNQIGYKLAFDLIPIKKSGNI